MTLDPATAPVLVWFRDDLRVADNPALAAAAQSGRPVVCVYLLEENEPGLRPLGAAARWWLAGSLRALHQALAQRGARLVLRRGQASRVIPALAAEAHATLVLWNRRVGHASAVDDGVADALQRGGAHSPPIEVQTFQASLLHEPPLLNKSGTPFQVFTPFWRTLRTQGAPRRPLPAPKRIPPGPDLSSDQLDDWALEPSAPDWAGEMRSTWTRGEQGAQERLAAFLDDSLRGYAGARDRPDQAGTTRLSPHLRFGEISPTQIWHAAQMASDSQPGASADGEKLLAEIGWRDFSYHLLAQYPDLDRVNIDRRFDRFPWLSDPAALRAWQRGKTGYPLVDAGMRQLWRTGWMHNRVRMIVASFLVKHLLIDWREGERWFWDTLVDADPANNPASWQWVAGCGADAAPYFRIFNPIVQGERFDPAGAYVRAFVPELVGVSPRTLHQPWTTAPLDLAAAGVRLGRDYPGPMVDHAAARERALAALATLRT